jgi:NmrA-like family
LGEKIVNDPASEEQQGKNLVDAAKTNGVKCFVWSTLPSSIAISNGKYCSRIYENKYKVDAYMRETGVEGPFLYTGNFFENSVLRGHVSLQGDELVFKQPVILEDTKRTEPFFVLFCFCWGWEADEEWRCCMLRRILRSVLK